MPRHLAAEAAPARFPIWLAAPAEAIQPYHCPSGEPLSQRMDPGIRRQTLDEQPETPNRRFAVCKLLDRRVSGNLIPNVNEAGHWPTRGQRREFFLRSKGSFPFAELSFPKLNYRVILGINCEDTFVDVVCHEMDFLFLSVSAHDINRSEAIRRQVQRVQC
jgi:hypothetical protein